MHILHSCTLSKCQSVNNAKGNLSVQHQKKKSDRARMQGMHGINNGKNDMVAKRKTSYSISGKIPFQYPEKGDSVPVVVYSHYGERCRCYEYGQ